MCEYNENDLRSGIHVFDDAEQEQSVYQKALDYYISIPF